MESLNNFTFLIKNKSDKTKNVTLFGYNKFCEDKNLGSDDDVLVITSDAMLTYEEFLKKINDYDFKINELDIISFNTAQVTQIITVQSNIHNLGNDDANEDEKYCMLPLIPQCYYTAYQTNVHSIHIDKYPFDIIYINGNMCLTFPILPYTELTLQFKTTKNEK